jgi:3-hydroxyisobutyrate dehydrogenase
MKLGFIRLGKMGTGIVHNFRAGHKLTVYNRTRAKAEDFASEGARGSSIAGFILRPACATAVRGCEAL